MDNTNTNGNVYADSAYYSDAHDTILHALNYRSKITRKGCRHRQLTALEWKGNRTKSRTRCRVEHVFGAQLAKAGTKLIRCIGIKRAELVIELRNLTYNLCRYVQLVS